MISMLSKLATLITLADARVHAKILRMMVEGARIPLWGKPWAFSWKLVVRGTFGSFAPALTIEQCERIMRRIVEAEPQPKRYGEFIRLFVESMMEELNGGPVNIPPYSEMSAALKDLQVNLDKDIKRCGNDCQKVVNEELGNMVSRIADNLAKGNYKTVILPKN